MKRICLFIFLGSTFFYSCKKDTDETGPEITINTPVENQSFNVFDYISVNADIKDDHKITSVSISLSNDQFVGVNHGISVAVSSPSMHVNTTYQLDNIHLETGYYNLEVTASDGKNDSHKYRKIYVVAVPRVLKKIMVATSSSTSQTNYSTVDSAFTTLIPYHIFSGDYIGTSMSSYDQELYSCGNYTGKLYGYDFQNNVQSFAVNPLVSGAPYFTGYYGEERNIYVARYDGNITGYSYSGDVLYNALANSGYYATKIKMNDEYLYAEEQDKTSSGKLLVTYYPSGVALQQTPLAQDAISFL